MSFSLSRRSVKNLDGVHPDLWRVVELAIERTPVDFTVACGVRTVKEQEALYAQGRTKPGKIVTWSMNSMHLIQRTGYSHAVDLNALVSGTVIWDWDCYARINEAMQAAAKELGVHIVWGGDWKMRDGRHWELDRRYYT